MIKIFNGTCREIRKHSFSPDGTPMQSDRPQGPKTAEEYIRHFLADNPGAWRSEAIEELSTVHPVAASKYMQGGAA